MNWRGVYPAGPIEVHAKHWWSRTDRKAARLAAKLLAYELAHAERPGVVFPFDARHIKPLWRR